MRSRMLPVVHQPPGIALLVLQVQRASSCIEGTGRHRMILGDRASAGSILLPDAGHLPG